ncbi:hypothetical protein BDR03DRAFT_970193 [Suillus americanus]|nr:hypothetical protein BDR03DRAFT_970193 [Suillus americanus]
MSIILLASRIGLMDKRITNFSLLCLYERRTNHHILSFVITSLLRCAVLAFCG